MEENTMLSRSYKRQMWLLSAPIPAARSGNADAFFFFTAGATVAYFPPHHFPSLLTSKIRGPRAAIGGDKQRGAKHASREPPTRLPGFAGAGGCGANGATSSPTAWRTFLQHLL